MNERLTITEFENYHSQFTSGQNIRCIIANDNNGNDLLNPWISVDDRLPDDERRVFILYRYKDTGKLTPFIGEYNPFECHWRNILNDVSIAYWADIPEPPNK